MSNVKSKARYLKEPFKIIRALGSRGVFNWMPDKPYLKLVYWGETGKRLNLDNPVSFNEKLQWLKLYNRKPEYRKYVDKFAVRSYISEAIGEQYLIPLLSVYEDVEEIDWDVLPKEFVLKCTHGSGCNIICADRDKLDIQTSILKLNKWMKKSWYWFGREWPYKNVRPRIICEKYISETDKPPNDYKVLCFEGKAKLIQVHYDRFTIHKQDFYDVNWNKTEILQRFPMSNILLNKPPALEKMLQLSEVLSQNQHHLRIDWYVVKDKLYFGEITFFDASGFCPFDKEEHDIMLGGWINLEREAEPLNVYSDGG